MPVSPFNVLVTGVGGQGIATLASVLWRLSDGAGFACQGAIIKGGAQRFGRVAASLRIFIEGETDYDRYSCNIADGELDLLIALEPWEALRSARLFGARTHLIVNDRPFPLHGVSPLSAAPDDPVQALRRLGLPLIAADYGQLAEANFGNAKMANVVIAGAAIGTFMPFLPSRDLPKVFAEVTGDARSWMTE